MVRLIAASAMAVASLVALPTSAVASCVGPVGPAGPATLQAQLNRAPTVFVGTVVATRDNNRVARVQVDSVWKGSQVLATVTVSGTPDQNAAATSVDRTFKSGERYLFAPTTSTAPFQDNSCTPTREYTPELNVLKPAAARLPVPGSDGLDPTGLAFVSPWLWPTLVVGITVLGAGGWLLRRRRRAPPNPMQPTNGSATDGGVASNR